MTAAISFAVAGTPVVKGNLRSGSHGRSYYPNGPAIEAWTRLIRDEARAAMAGADALREAVAVRLAFELRRPDSHYRTNGSLKPTAPAFPHQRIGDVDKLERCALDALSKLVFGDDCQVVDLRSSKRYVDRWQTGGVSVDVVEVLP